MNKVPYLYLTKTGQSVKITYVNDFATAFTSYKKTNMKPKMVASTDHFVIHLDIKLLYPPLDISLDCLDFTKLSLTFPVCPHPADPQTPQFHF